MQGEGIVERAKEDLLGLARGEFEGLGPRGWIWRQVLTLRRTLPGKEARDVDWERECRYVVMAQFLGGL